MELISKTTSACPVCFEKVNAEYFLSGEKLFLRKNCSAHGEFTVLISSRGADYLSLKKFLTAVIPAAYPKNRTLVYAADSCNLDCPICYFGGRDQFGVDPTAADLKMIAKKTRGELNLCAREVCTRKDVLSLIQALKDSKKPAAIYSNGIELANFDFARKLKHAGLGRVELSFDGFKNEIYQKTRGLDLYEKKAEALNNLKKLRIPTILMVTVMSGVNNDSLRDILEYAVNNRFIAGIMFMGYAVYGRNEQPELSPDPDGLMSLLERQTSGKIKVRDCVVFQKLLYLYLGLTKQGTCVHFRDVWLFRVRGGYVPVYEIFDTDKLDQVLMSFVGRDQPGRTRPGEILRLLAGVIKSIKNWRLSARMFLEFFGIIVSHLVFKVYQGGAGSRILRVNFHSVCDPFRVDYSETEYCATDFTYKDGTGRFSTQSLALALIDTAKRSRKRNVNAGS